MRASIAGHFALLSAAALAHPFRDCPDCPDMIPLPTDGAPRIDGDCAQRAVRGGAWNHAPRDIRTGFSYGDVATDRAASNGLRVVRFAD